METGAVKNMERKSIFGSVLAVKRMLILLLTLTLAVSLIGCSQKSNENVLDKIRHSPAAKIECSDGSSVLVDSEIAILRSFADLRLTKTSSELSENEGDWLYRIVFNPAEKRVYDDEIIVSFYKDHIRIDSECYVAEDGLPFDRILEWVESKYDYFASQYV